jgi:hypothetical protein
MALIIVNGMGPEYNAFVISATTTSRHHPFFFSDLHSLLLSHEALLTSQSSVSTLPSLTSPSAFYNQTPFSTGANPRPPYNKNQNPKFNPHINFGPSYKPAQQKIKKPFSSSNTPNPTLRTNKYKDPPFSPFSVPNLYETRPYNQDLQIEIRS